MSSVRGAAVVLLLVAACGGASGEAAAFVTKDGFRLEGELHGSGPRGVALVHAPGADRRSWRSYARTLAGQGFNVLAFDLRGHGGSAGDRSPAQADRDVGAATEFLRSSGASAVVLVCASTSGLSCLRAAASGAPVAGVATLSVPPDPMTVAISQVVVPKLYLVAEGDTASVAANEALLTASPDPRNLLRYPGTKSGTALLDSPKAADDLLAFIRASLP